MVSSIISDFISSLQLLFIGYIPAAAIGIVLGVILGINGFIYQFFKWIIKIPYSFLPITLLPIFLILLPEKEAAKIIIVFLSSLWSIILNTSTGIHLGRNQGNNFRIVINRIFDGLQFAIWVAWLVVITMEMLIGNQGLGYLVWNSYKTNNYNSMVQGVIYISVIAFLLDQLLEITGNILAQLVSEGKKSDT
ncbi:ABC transporter permease [Calothrix sp. 336/3]|uniref:ABC transporter permease n=1 Tax=Calothrix sp. 336/3 TaxID=1337936 RepID=UPI0004E38FA1|nr:nitrate transporter [Calothrix sp. 336/3]AKG21551.1 nitrate transporter [Calothrix sp. 336/3]